MSFGMLKATANKMAKTYINKYDADGNGELSYEESKQMLAELPLTLTKVASSMLPTDIESNDSDELMSRIANEREGIEVLFAAFDTNCDGSLTSEELCLGFEQMLRNT